MGEIIIGVLIFIALAIGLYLSSYSIKIHNYRVYYLKALLKRINGEAFEKGAIWMYENMRYQNFKSMYADGKEIYDTPIWPKLYEMYDKNYAEFLPRDSSGPLISSIVIDRLLEEEGRSVNLPCQRKGMITSETLRFKNG